MWTYCLWQLSPWELVNCFLQFPQGKRFASWIDVKCIYKSPFLVAFYIHLLHHWFIPMWTDCLWKLSPWELENCFSQFPQFLFMNRCPMYLQMSVFCSFLAIFIACVTWQYCIMAWQYSVGHPNGVWHSDSVSWHGDSVGHTNSDWHSDTVGHANRVWHGNNVSWHVHSVGHANGVWHGNSESWHGNTVVYANIVCHGNSVSWP